MTDPGKTHSDTPPELAVVVISLRAPESLAGAVASLLEQDAPLEIVVVNSWGGDAQAKLMARGIDVMVIERQERVSPGAAAVGSALLPLPADSVIAWASHLSLFVRRLPQNSRLTALPYGASFRRSLFESHGLFSEETRIGEDTEFAARLPAEARPLWAPEVVAFRETPTRLASMLADQLRRGKLAAAYETDAYHLGSLFKLFWRRTTDPMKLSRRMGLSGDKTIRRAWLLLPLCAAAYCLGLASGRKRTPMVS